ncbi:MAG TPA: PAS domain-containing sensor histidine kinase [Candidatus Thermoplasmatota archaeon]|nr:PAS domain-containing sensor histidine kinase [Candidatus Thermoplasmatota archaeon]
MTATATRSWDWLRAGLPEGLRLPAAAWETRHRVVVFVLALHAVLLPLFGMWHGWGYGYILGEGALIAALTLLAARRSFSRRFRSATAALAAVTSSAVLVQFSGGYIEAHFHYFIMVALVALYQDWIPFLLAISYVALSHGVIGSLEPTWVYNHAHATANPWQWAAIHAVAVLAECAALLVFWGESERARARADLMLESAGEAVLGLGLDGKVAYANPAAARLLGAPLPSLLGQDVRRRFHASGRSDPWEVPPGTPVEGTLATPQGPLAVEWTVAPTQRGGVTVGHHVIVRDITTRRQAEEDRRSVELLREKDQLKTQLLHAASHELNTPVAILRYQLQWLRTKGSAEPAAQEGLAVLEKNVERLSHLVRDTLEAARIEGGRLSLRPRGHDLAALVREACAPLAGMARERGIALDVEAEPLPVQVDGERITQVLFNLLSNALNFTPAGGRIHVVARRHGAAARVEVRDTGPGVASEHLGLLFRPFSQVPGTPSRTAAGTGLGLFISKGIVDQHGGRIWCEALPGQGGRFLFEVPLDLVRLGEGPPDGLQQLAGAEGLLHAGADAGSKGALVQPRV